MDVDAVPLGPFPPTMGMPLARPTGAPFAPSVGVLVAPPTGGVEEVDRGEVTRLVAAGLLRWVVAGVAAPEDTPDCLLIRASALLVAVPARVRDVGGVVGLDAAVWLYCGGEGPVALDVLLPRGVNRPAADPLQVHQVVLADPDVARVHGLAVTDPVRTAADLARDSAVAPGNDCEGSTRSRRPRGSVQRRCVTGSSR